MKKRCPGCKSCLSGKIPDFETEEEEEAFWDQHSPSQFPLRTVHVKVRGRPPEPLPKQRITLMIHQRLKEQLIHLAEERGLGYQTLIQEFLLERVEQELHQSQIGLKKKSKSRLKN